MPIHILVPLQGAEFGYYFDNAALDGQDDSTVEDRFRTVGKELLGRAFSPHFGWRIEGQSVYITKPTALETSHRNPLPNKIHSHRDTFSLIPGEQRLGDGTMIYLVDLLQAMGAHTPHHDQLQERRAQRSKLLLRWTKRHSSSKIS